MITRKPNENQSRKQTKAYVTDPLALLKRLNLTPQQMHFSADAAQDFHFKAPMTYVDNIQVGKPDDPLLLQIFPVQQELEPVSGYTKDPLAEADSLFQPGLLQKYNGRALLLLTPGCAINCRYCFRRHFPYSPNNPYKEKPYEDKGYSWKQIEKNIQLIKQDSSISEVILSGGDPLSLSNDRFSRLVTMLESIPHLKRLRIHSRFPVVEPQRISDEFISILSNSQLQIIMVLHINHAQELGTDSQASIAKLRKQQILLLNQSVLLKGINDSVEILSQLSEALIENHIIPYYLHMLDHVQGSAHFEVSENDAVQIHQQLRAVLPGYMLPRLVREIAGEQSKSEIYSELNHVIRHINPT